MNAGIPDREMCDVLERIEVAHADGEESWTVAEMGFRYRGAGALTPGRAVVAGVFAMTPDDPEQIRSRVDHYMKQRAESQPINRPSCGSVFKNPEGDFAGRLIEAAGMKGSRSGLAMISDRHANFIVTERGARAEDVLFLIERARQRVFEESGVALVPEVRIIGRGADDLDLPLERES